MRGGGDQIRQLSTTLFADYLLPFEAASVILLVSFGRRHCAGAEGAG